MIRHVSDDLSAYIDGALGVREMERVKAHLDTCPGCQQDYQGLQAVQTSRWALTRSTSRTPSAPSMYAERSSDT